MKVERMDREIDSLLRTLPFFQEEVKPYVPVRRCDGFLSRCEFLSCRIILSLCRSASPATAGICGSDPANGRNSKSEVLLCLLSLYTMIPADTVMVGDRKYDAVGASDAGLDFIGVLWGFGDSAELSEYAPVLMPSSCNELVRALLL